MTARERAVLDTVLGWQGLITLDALAEQLEQGPRLTRTLADRLVKAGWLEEQTLGSSDVRYRPSAKAQKQAARAEARADAEAEPKVGADIQQALDETPLDAAALLAGLRG